MNLKFDEYEDLAFSDEMARLDNFALQLQSQPRARGFVIVYAGKKALVAEAKNRRSATGGPRNLDKRSPE